MELEPGVTWASAELVFLLTRADDLLIVLKTAEQRNAEENRRVKRGLRRGLCLEFLLFVPASAALIILMTPLLASLSVLSVQQGVSGAHSRAVAALLGVVSYGFPFAALKRMMSRIALGTLREFASIQHRDLGESSVGKADGE